MDIRVTYERDGVDPVGFLTSEHIADYGASLRQEIEAEYPNATVEVVEGNRYHVDVTTPYDTDMLDDAPPYPYDNADPVVVVWRALADHWQPWIDKVAMQIDRVPNGCPECGEARVDYLVWQNDDTVTCTTCGHEYTP